MLRTVGGGYLLSVTADQLDAQMFERRIRDARAELEADQPARASELIARTYYEWVDFERA
ncbi:MAG: hypothetical protein JO168_05520 [Solirubrobacterales bacterium]|nr:hypothetical protein [Solirubrobacterales bacterium]